MFGKQFFLFWLAALTSMAGCESTNEKSTSKNKNESSKTQTQKVENNFSEIKTADQAVEKQIETMNSISRASEAGKPKQQIATMTDQLASLNEFFADRFSEKKKIGCDCEAPSRTW